MAAIVCLCAGGALGAVLPWGVRGRDSGSNGLFASGTETDTTTIVPEYVRHMETVLLSVDHRTSDLSEQHEFLRRIPGYTNVVILAPRVAAEAVRKAVERNDYTNDVQIITHGSVESTSGTYYVVAPECAKLMEVHAEPSFSLQGSLWAQDLFETVRTAENRLVLLVPEVYKWFAGAAGRGSTNVISDTSVLQAIDTPRFSVRCAPIPFQGGNVLFDVRNGRRHVYCGIDVLNAAALVRAAMQGEAPDERELRQTVADAFGADELHIIGTDVQPPSLMFHLDQAVVLLANRTAAVTKIVDIRSEAGALPAEMDEVRGFLEAVRAEFAKGGYRVVHIEQTTADILDHRLYVNGIPFINRETGVPTYFMPVFPGHENDPLVRENADAFAANGYQVVLVPVTANRRNGGLHCLVNVIE